MAVDIVIPEVGELSADVTFVRWLKEEGDEVAEGDALFEVDTEKSLFEVEAFSTGRLGDLDAVAGDKLQPHQVVARLYEGDEWEERGAVDEQETAAEPTREDEPTHDSRPVVSEVDPGAIEIQRGSSKSRFAISPRARRLADERKIDVASLRGSGPDGLITERDVVAAAHGVEGQERTGEEDRARSAEQSPDPAAERHAKVRRAVIDRTVAAWQQVPHFTLFMNADVTDALGSAKPMALVASALVEALNAHPECNVEWSEAQAVRRSAIDIGVLVDTADGLLLAAVRDTGTLTSEQLGNSLRDAAGRAREGRLLASDFPARSVTISNLGMFSVDGFIGIVPTPDCLLMTVGRTRTEPRWRGDKWVPRQILPLGLSIDHRALDGADGARLLTAVEKALVSGGENA